MVPPLVVPLALDAAVVAGAAAAIRGGGVREGTPESNAASPFYAVANGVAAARGWSHGGSSAWQEGPGLSEENFATATLLQNNPLLLAFMFGSAFW